MNRKDQVLADFREAMLVCQEIREVDKKRLLDGKGDGTYYVVGVTKGQALQYAQISKDVALNPEKNLASKFDAWRVYQVALVKKFTGGQEAQEKLLASSSEIKAEKRERMRA